MKTVDSCFLIGAALDWAVAKCVGLIQGKIAIDAVQNGFYTPSSEWSQGGPIIEHEKISLIHVEDGDPYPIEDGPWSASVKGLDYGVTGPTALVAAMRCYVCWKLGAVIEIPEELSNE